MIDVDCLFDAELYCLHNSFSKENMRNGGTGKCRKILQSKSCHPDRNNTKSVLNYTIWIHTSEWTYSDRVTKIRVKIFNVLKYSVQIQT